MSLFQRLDNLLWLQGQFLITLTWQNLKIRKCSNFWEAENHVNTNIQCFHFFQLPLDGHFGFSKWRQFFFLKWLHLRLGCSHRILMVLVFEHTFSRSWNRMQQHRMWYNINMAEKNEGKKFNASFMSLSHSFIYWCLNLSPLLTYWTFWWDSATYVPASCKWSHFKENSLNFSDLNIEVAGNGVNSVIFGVFWVHVQNHNWS